MSAFVVHRNHVLYLVAAMLPGALGRYPFSYCHVGRAVTIDTPAAAAIAANVLAAENARSVRARYGERNDAPADTFRASQVPNLVTSIDPAQVMRSVECLEYQSCETADWETTEAAAMLRALYRQAAHVLCERDATRRGVELVWGMDSFEARKLSAVRP